MEKNKKRKYVKPMVTRIVLDAKTAVLGNCKLTGGSGSSGDDCGAPLYCFTDGS